ncbi:2-oxoglutarate-dependent dioxygenase [Penicillium ucsense]|uniref:2-oxoglutarate-dependent dioxygenase n=1 Tax=Penicillium ucsense TaxID=2839758 RepID=A0A8J8VZ26_9EURO|nr:2-oxoglutarate-dependent dioxygenase [Penicillium ucsense]KAF7733701.1 2-oxoglutarate-dependent dioxygenase [Penicillium ucsense]
MSTDNSIVLPIVDLSGYLHPKSPADKARVIAEVREACSEYGFFQVKGHGVPLDMQKALLRSLRNIFSLPQEEKLKLSFLNNPCRRGYEASGMSVREGDAMADSKEAFYIGREDPVIERPGFYGPNVWPDLAEEDFHGPVWEYYQATDKLGKMIWEILLQGLGHPPSLMEAFAKRPFVQMKMIRYPPASATLPGQYGVGAHTDFGGVTVLLQEAGREGLEVWHEGRQEWLPVPAMENMYIINCGDMIQNWSGGQYKSAKHRVINKSDHERLSCATFWHGDVGASNPLNPSDPNRETVGQLLVKRFGRQFSLSKTVVEQVRAS